MRATLKKRAIRRILPIQLQGDAAFLSACTLGLEFTWKAMEFTTKKRHGGPSRA